MDSALGDFPYDSTIVRAMKAGEKVPAEVSKRGVMIGNFEGALSSRRKRAVIIIEERRKKSRENRWERKKTPAVFLTAEKGEK
jgi:hypothetical protein